MFKKFFKYVTQSMAGMIGISIYILADTFFISLHSGANGLTVLNLILPGLRRAVCNRGNDRNRFCDKILHHKIKR